MKKQTSLTTLCAMLLCCNQAAATPGQLTAPSAEDKQAALKALTKASQPETTPKTPVKKDYDATHFGDLPQVTVILIGAATLSAGFQLVRWFNCQECDEFTWFDGAIGDGIRQLMKHNNR